MPFTMGGKSPPRDSMSDVFARIFKASEGEIGNDKKWESEIRSIETHFFAGSGGNGGCLSIGSVCCRRAFAGRIPAEYCLHSLARFRTIFAALWSVGSDTATSAVGAARNSVPAGIQRSTALLA